ncbi:hypothetical protein [Streptomyces sp. NPDC047108]|uniref:hypothetical protein n=1 Tax=Streptomyces sp. NPDC047108 TaxID=3155025 RepID=UPI0034093D27
MSWHDSPIFLNWVLPALLSAGVAWVCLIRQYHGKGRLLGTRRSVLHSAGLLGAMAAVAVVLLVLLPLLGKVPPIAVGVATGAGVVSRGRVQADTTKPFTGILTLGTAHLLERLEERMATDCADWADAVMTGFEDITQMQLFAHEVKAHALARQSNKNRRKSIEACYEEADDALGRATNVHAAIGEACRLPTPGGLPEERRLPTAAESVELHRAWAEAEHSLKLLLQQTYVYGRRSDDTALLALRDTRVTSRGYRETPVPAQRR